MTIEGILGSSEAPVEELANRFTERTIRSDITLQKEQDVSFFIRSVERAVKSIVDSSITDYCYLSQEKVELTEEAKIDLLKFLKEICYKKLDAYKDSLDYLFGKEETPKKEKKVKITLAVPKEVETPGAINVPQYFGY